MNDYISKEYIINKFKEHRELYITYWGDFSTMPITDKVACDVYAACCADVVNAPGADVQPVRCGRWEEEHFDELLNCYSAICSECGYESLDLLHISDSHKYCEKCGARMIKDGERK